MKIDPGKTTLEIHGLRLALFLAYNFPDLREKVPTIAPKSKEAAKKIQKFLDDNANRIDQNGLRGILAVVDTFRNATGGRVHLVPGLWGPIGECFNNEVMGGKIEYEFKSTFLLNAVGSVSDKRRPAVGNIHVHPFLLSNSKRVFIKDILEFIRDEHQSNNDIQQIAPSKVFILDYNNGGTPRWVPAGQDDVIRMFSSRSHYVEVVSRMRMKV